MGKYTLVAMDTDHIKRYVFATDRLKDIRGASSILDRLNRQTMKDEADAIGAKRIYNNGGSGMFLVPGDKKAAIKFAQSVQREYINATRGAASLSFAVEEIPGDVDDPLENNPITEETPEETNRRKDNQKKIKETLDLLNIRLILQKTSPQPVQALPSHPFMLPCGSCGVQYAEGRDTDTSNDPGERNKRHCQVCLGKRDEDEEVKDQIEDIIEHLHSKSDTNDNRHKHSRAGRSGKDYSYIWNHLLTNCLPKGYVKEQNTRRPQDFDTLSSVGGSKDYLALIYADGNSMGQTMKEITSLSLLGKAANAIDDAIYKSVSTAIEKHLLVVKTKIKGKGKAEEEEVSLFPFDILLIGGDDTMIATSAAHAPDVALTLAATFYKETKPIRKEIEQAKIDEEKKGELTGKGFSLAVSIVLAPMKYPFGLLHELIESTLKSTKKESAKHSKHSEFGTTSLNFVVVAGSTSNEFDRVYASLHSKNVPTVYSDKKTDFYATLRPYTVEEWESLLALIREGKKLSLGRTKLHQIREAVLKMNLTTSVGDAFMVLRNWRKEQRDFIVQQVYTIKNQPNSERDIIEHPEKLSQFVPFPWFRDENGAYRTPLLDFVELYDFVPQEGGSSAHTTD